MSQISRLTTKVTDEVIALMCSGADFKDAFPTIARNNNIDAKTYDEYCWRVRGHVIAQQMLMLRSGGISLVKAFENIAPQYSLRRNSEGYWAVLRQTLKIINAKAGRRALGHTNKYRPRPKKQIRLLPAPTRKKHCGKRRDEITLPLF